MRIYKLVVHDVRLFVYYLKKAMYSVNNNGETYHK